MAQITWNEKTVNNNVMNTDITIPKIFNILFNLPHDNTTIFFWKNPMECEVTRDSIPCGKGIIILTKEEIKQIEQLQNY
jgi:hypothetical protein